MPITYFDIKKGKGNLSVLQVFELAKNRTTIRSTENKDMGATIHKMLR
jgi:hypothetical protein